MSIERTMGGLGFPQFCGAKNSRRGRRLRPINEAERNGLFCNARSGRAKQILGKHYLFCLSVRQKRSIPHFKNQNLKKEVI